MRRISTTNRAQNLFGVGKDGWKNGVAGTSDRPTEGQAEWFNAVQEELCAVIEGQGIEIDPSRRDQLATAIGQRIGAAVAPNITHPLARLGDEINLTSSALPISLGRNRGGYPVDRHVLLLGDSHSWGQGAPCYERFTQYANVSPHSAHPHALGFMSRIKSFIEGRLGIGSNVWCGGASSVMRLMPFALKSAPFSTEGMRAIIPVFGVLRGGGAVQVSGASSFPNFYQPKALGDAYSADTYREKAEAGLFPLDLVRLEPETALRFDSRDKPYHFEFVPYLDNPGSGASYTGYSNGGVLVVERETATGKTYIEMARTEFPYGMLDAGKTIFIPGYGVLTVTNLFNTTGTSVGLEVGVLSVADATKLAKVLVPGAKIYSGHYITKQLYYVDMERPSRVIYIAVRHAAANTGSLRLFFGTQEGAAEYAPFIERGAAGGTFRMSTADSRRDWIGSASERVAHAVSSTGSLVASAKATILTASGEGTNIATIDCTPITVGVDEDVVYRIDLGTRMRGRLYVEATGVVTIRGITFDNNKVANWAMGGHTVGQWMGDSASFNDAAHDHVADVLSYTPARPSHVIVQLPIVNEYLRQTPLATFKANIQALVDRFRAHLAGTNNVNTQGCDFLFFTTLRDRRVAFQGVGQSVLTYDAYVQAAREACSAQGLAFVDVEAKLFNLVQKHGIDYQRLYNDDIHPSDFANEMIFRCLEPHLYAVL
ncbi:MAG: SGNH/GDSL hydrolase family protein [Rubrivivax sp.]